MSVMLYGSAAPMPRTSRRRRVSGSSIATARCSPASKGARRSPATSRSSSGGFSWTTRARTAGAGTHRPKRERRGQAAVLLERLLRRDGRTIDEAIAIARTHYGDLTRAQLDAMAAGLPDRPPPPRLVAIDDGDEERFAGIAAGDDLVAALDVRDRSREASRAVRAALVRLTPDDRVILRLRFGKGMSVADIARALGLAQRPLYRRLESLFAGLRRTLEANGVDARTVADLAGGAGELLDFGLATGADDAAPPLSTRPAKDPSGVPEC